MYSCLLVQRGMVCMASANYSKIRNNPFIFGICDGMRQMNTFCSEKTLMCYALVQLSSFWLLLTRTLYFTTWKYICLFLTLRYSVSFCICLEFNLKKISNMHITNLTDYTSFSSLLHVLGSYILWLKFLELKSSRYIWWQIQFLHWHYYCQCFPHQSKHCWCCSC